MSATIRTSSWGDSAENAANGSSARPLKPAYVPPHLRNRSMAPAEPPSMVANANDRGLGNWGSSSNFNKPEFGAGRQGYGSGGGFNNRGGGGAVREHGGRREVNPFENDVNESFSEQENTGINFDAYDDIPVETSGENVPPPVNTFAEIDLGDALNQNIQRCKYVKPTPVQRYAIPISLAGRDLMACAQTGSGKTAAFCFPIISGILREQYAQRPRVARTAYPLALILSPTRELSCQVRMHFNEFLLSNLCLTCLFVSQKPMICFSHLTDT